MNNAQPFELIQEIKPVNPCQVHERELFIDAYNQAYNNPGGPWVMVKDENLIRFSCKLCNTKRLYKQTSEKILL